MWNQLRELLADIWYDESGATLIEYAMTASLIAMAIVSAVKSISTSLVGTIETVGNALL